MTDAERHTIEIFKGAVNRIKTGADGYPITHEMLDVELQATGRLVLEVDQILLPHRDELDAELRSVLALADATSNWIAETESGNRDPAIAQAWFRARAELIEPL